MAFEYGLKKLLEEELGSPGRGDAVYLMATGPCVPNLRSKSLLSLIIIISLLLGR